MTTNEEYWSAETVDGAAVRLRSGKIGLVNVDVTAPVAGGRLHVTQQRVHMTLRLALDQLRTGNFILQAAARTLVTRHDAHVLTYSGEGPAGARPWVVVGRAVAGNVDVEIQLTITPVGPADDELSEVELVGSASFGTVNLPLPGLGKVDDFTVDLDARLGLSSSA